MDIKTIVTFTLIVLSTACDAAYDNMKSWVDDGDRKAFIDEMKRRGIAHRVDERSRIWYSHNDLKVVDEISEQILARGEFHGVSFEDPSDYRKFKDLLKAEGIPFSVRSYLNKEWVVWDEKHDAVAKRIREQVEDQNMQGARRTPPTPR